MRWKWWRRHPIGLEISTTSVCVFVSVCVRIRGQLFVEYAPQEGLDKYKTQANKQQSATTNTRQSGSTQTHVHRKTHFESVF